MRFGDDKSSVRVYSFQAYDGDKLIMDLVPVAVYDYADGEIVLTGYGFYDKVAKTDALVPDSDIAGTGDETVHAGYIDDPD